MPKSTRLSCHYPTLYPKAFIPTTPIPQRKTDIGTSSTRYGNYLGDNDRNNILAFFQQNAQALNLRVYLGLNANSKQRFDRTEWCQFLNSCKATLAIEASSFYLQRDDQLLDAITAYLKTNSQKITVNPNTRLITLIKKIIPTHYVSALKQLIAHVDQLDAEANFALLFERFFANTPRCPFYSKAISSQHFDAAGTQTLQILYPGRYNDILKTGEHYFELQRDHSNTEALIALLNTPQTIQDIIERAHDHVIAHHTHQHHLGQLLELDLLNN